MTWYKAGTVTATNNSDTITGVGTTFISNIRVGDGVTVAGSTSLHEVTNIVSETQLTISPVYSGTTGSGKSYAIIPVQGYVKDLADQAKALILAINQSSATSAIQVLSTLTPAANRIPYYTGTGTAALLPVDIVGKAVLAAVDQAAARTALGLGTTATATLTTSVTDQTPGRVLRAGDGGLQGAPIARRTLVDMNSERNTEFYYNDMTTSENPFGVFGSGVHIKYPASGRFFDLFAGVNGAATRLFARVSQTGSLINNPVELYHTGNAVGTVSQTSGITTGSIFERGSNASGDYIKYADGTMICFRAFTTASLTSTAAGGIYRIPAQNVGSLPAVFVNTPIVNASGTDSTGGGWIGNDTFPTTTTWGQWSLRNAVSGTGTTTIYLIAIGRWF